DIGEKAFCIGKHWKSSEYPGAYRERFLHYSSQRAPQGWWAVFSSSRKPAETACDPRTLWQNTYQQLRAAGRKPPAHQTVYRQGISRPRGILSLYRHAPFP
ncbi:hypothetical protein ACTWBP_004955, partial [Klebsiella pneumoniae]